MADQVGPSAESREDLTRLVVLGGVLTAAMVYGTVGQFAIAALGPFITAEFGLSRSSFGALVTAMFLGAALASPSLGVVTDRWGERTLLVGHFLLATAALCLIAAAGGYVTLLVAALVGGLPQALGNPLTNALVARHVSGGHRGTLIGVKQSGTQLGAMLTGLALPAIAGAVGWRAAVLVTAGIGLALAASTWPVVTSERPRVPSASEAYRTSIWPTVRWLAAYAVLMGASVSAATTYLPLFAFDELGMSAVRAGQVAALVGGLGVLARVAWGWWGERARRIAVSLGILAVGSVVSQVAIMVATDVGQWALWLGAAGFGVTASAWNSVGMLAVLRLLHPADTGRASGWILTGFFAGFIVSPPLFGWLVDLTGSYRPGWLLITVAVGLAALLSLVWALSDRGAPPPRR